MIVTDLAGEERMNLEEKLSGIIKRLGLGEWAVLWRPDPTRHSRGQILPEAKIIIIYDNEPEAARETLLHEVIEIKLRPILRPYRDLVNSLIDWADKQTYEAKEGAIEDLLPILVKYVEYEVEGPSPMKHEEAR
jgi:hypothetical protein